MASENASMVGRVASVWRYPVKSMRGEEVDESEVAEAGLLGDRAFALFDMETGKVASAKSPRMWPDLLDFSAAFVEPPSPDQPLPPVRIELPSGESIRTDDPSVDEALSSATGRRVRLISSNPDGATYEQYLPPIEGADPQGGDLYRDIPNDLFGTGSLHDASPIHLLTTATLDRLAELYPEGRFDVRRFRPNVVVATDTPEPQFVENDWVKCELEIGGVGVRITMPTLRCVMTTRPQGDLPRDLGILRTATQHNRIPVLSAGSFPCVGVNGLVQRPGAVRRGAPVKVAPGS